MRNFLRALRYAWPYRYRLGLSIFCALAAAVFWGLNFTAIYPILKILGSEQKQNLHQWVDSEIKRTQKDIASLESQVADLTRHGQNIEQLPVNKLRNKEERHLAGDLAKTESKLEAARHELYRFQLVKHYVYLIFPQDRFNSLALVIGLVVLAVAIKGFFEFGQETLVGSVVNLALFGLRNRFYRNVIHLDVNAFSAEGTHESMARLTNDMEILAAGLKTLFGKVVAEPLRALACVAIACWISWQLTLMFLILVPVALFILTKVGRMMKRATRRLLERMSHIYKHLQETFVGIRVVKAFTREPYERRRFATATRDYYHKSMWVAQLDAMAGPIIELLGVAAVALALLAGAYLVLTPETHLFGLRMSDRQLDAETLLQLYALLAAIADPVRKLSSVYTRIQSGTAASDRIFQFMDRQPRVMNNSLGPRLERHQRDIEFRDVCFSYHPGHSILTGVHLHVFHGETIAIVGKNGSGKTTLLNLLPRFYDPDHGSIYIDGLDIRMVNLRSLRHQIGVVTQDAILFDDTIYNNIAYGNKRAKKEDVERVAKLADAHGFILTKLANGYNTRIGEAGAMISGGQRQRLALARALLSDPSILILDEFTSQYDAESEALLHDGLREFLKGRTTFIITHRLNTLEIADRVVMVDSGRIVALGTHSELLNSCPLYQRWYEAQFQRRAA